MAPMKTLRVPAVFLVLIPCLLSLLPAAFASQEARDTERLRLLQRATGQPVANTSFQSRVDAIFDTSSRANPTYEYSARKDAEELKAVNARIEQEKALTDAALKRRNQGQSDTFDPRVAVRKDDAMDKKSLVDASEKTYQDDLERLAQEKNSSEPEKINLEKKTKREQEKSDMLPSLANNPFYFSPGTDPGQTSFEAGKPLILSRILQLGYSRDEAESMLRDSTNEEDLILQLMSNNVSYGDAKAVASTD